MTTAHLCLVRPVSDPLGLFIRAGRIARQDLQNFITSRAGSYWCGIRGQVSARHFLYQRTQQVVGLGQIPESLRPSRFLEEMVRPASDTALKVSTLELPDELTKKIHKQMKRLNALRTTLGPYARERRDASFAMHPVARTARAGGR